MAAPKITLYTDLGCPWAHRAHIALKELGLEYETKIVDLSVPRTPEYLAVNPRGLVPSLKYNDEIITESIIVAQFLIDAHPSHLLKTSSEPGGALQRARINFFVDTFFSKVVPLTWKALSAAAEDKETTTQAIVDATVKELEPLLKDANPFFGGSERLTLAEVLTGSFLLRLLSFPKYEGLYAPSLLPSLEEKAPNFWKWANAVVKENSVNYIYDEEKVANRTRARFAQLAVSAK